MKKSGRCTKCSGQKLLVIDPVQRIVSGEARPAPLASAWLPGGESVEAGRLAAVVCCACGYLEWYAEEIDQILGSLGDLHPTARLFDRDLHKAVVDLGLSVDLEGAHGWQLKASGVLEQVPLQVGQWARKRLFSNGIRYVLYLEILASARVDLGQYVLRRRDAKGREPGVLYQQEIRSGDDGLDDAFQLHYNGPRIEELDALDSLGKKPIGNVPWLDDEARGLFLSARPDETVIANETIGMLIRDYDPDTFPDAVALAVHLARWRGPSTHAYR